jgi:nitroreductase
MDAIRLAPSSSGLQPFRVIVVESTDLKEKIKPIAMGQSQITDASHLLIFASWDGYTEERIAEVFAATLAERGLPADAMDDYRKNLWGMYSQLPKEWHQSHTAKQSYIALGVGMVAAAEQKVDATPMEGFDPAALDVLLGLADKGLKSQAILALGYRDEANDWLVNMKKYRTPENEFFINM